MAETDVDELVTLETEVWEALVAGDAAADGRRLAADFLGVYPSGFADRADHMGQLDDGPTVADYELLEPRVIPVSDAAALLVYRARYRRPGPARPTEEMFISSLWCRREGDWINTFSQDTPAGPAAP